VITAEKGEGKAGFPVRRKNKTHIDHLYISGSLWGLVSVLALQDGPPKSERLSWD